MTYGMCMARTDILEVRLTYLPLFAKRLQHIFLRKKTIVVDNSEDHYNNYLIEKVEQ